MQGKLRQLAITVTERHPHAFRWAVVELLSDQTWVVLEEGPRAHRHYHHAMADGLLTLQSMTPDLDLGPRAPQPTEQARRPKVQEEDAGRAQRSAFGFGFGLPKFGSSSEE